MRQRRANASHETGEPQVSNGASHAGSHAGATGGPNEDSPERALGMPARRLVAPPRLLMPGPQLYTTLVQHREAEADQRANLEYVVDQKLRAAARQTTSPAPPPDFTAAVRASISRARIAPPPAPPLPWRRRVAARIGQASRRAQRAAHLTDTQWRAAVGGAGTLLAALVCGGVGFALDPTEMFALLGVAGALLVSLLALGHLLSALVGAVMGSTVLAALALALFVCLAAIWVRLMRQPVEA